MGWREFKRVYIIQDSKEICSYKECKGEQYASDQALVFICLHPFNLQSTLWDRNYYVLCVLSHSAMSDSLWPTVCDPPGSSVHGIFQVRILEWVAIPFFRGSSQPRDPTQVSCFAGRFFYSLSHQGSQEVLNTLKLHKSLISHQSAKILFIIFSFHLYSDIIDIQHCICLRCIAYCFD